MVLEVKIDHLRAEKMKVKHQSVFFGTPCRIRIYTSRVNRLENVFLFQRNHSLYFN